MSRFGSGFTGWVVWWGCCKPGVPCGQEPSCRRYVSRVQTVKQTLMFLRTSYLAALLFRPSSLELFPFLATS